MRAFRSAAVVSLLMVLAVTGCRRDHTEGPFEWKLFGVADVAQIRAEQGGRVLSLGFEVPAGRNCYRHVRARADQIEGGFVQVNVTFEQLQDTMGYTVARCRSIGVPPKALATARVTLPTALGERSVVIGQSSEHQYVAASPGDGPLRRCGSDGCHPAPTGCTRASYEQTVRREDIPRHTYWNARCNGHWLVIDFEMPTGPVCGDAPPGSCDPHAVTRHTFYRYAKAGWVTITSTDTGGCDAVLRVEPHFPRRLCATHKARH